MTTNIENEVFTLLEKRKDELHTKLLKESPDYQKLEGVKVAIDVLRGTLDNDTFKTLSETPDKNEATIKPKEKQPPLVKDRTVDSNGWPESGQRLRGRRIEWIVEQHDKAISKKDMEKKLKDKLGIKSEINVREALKRCITKKKLVYVKFGSSQRYAFLALKRWIVTSQDGHLLNELYMPDSKELPKNFIYKEQEVTF